MKKYVIFILDPSNTTMKKVYLSSTFLDLESYRKIVLELFNYVNWIFPANGMERYTAQSVIPLIKCLRDVRECDIYILLIAERYGYIPVDNILNPNERSITELEYEEAVKTGKEILVFHAMEGISDVVIDEDDEKKARLKAFRTRVTSFWTSSRSFSTLQELSVQLCAALIQWQRDNPNGGSKFFDEKSIYCCDRTVQFTEYERTRIKPSSNFHVFITNGHEKDTGGNLVNRCAIFSLHLNETEIFPIAFDEFYRNTYESSKEHFFFQLRQKIATINEKLDIPASEVIAEINAKGRDYTVIKMNCVEQFLDENRIQFLIKIFQELYEGCGKVQFTKYIHFFLNIEDDNDKHEESGIVAQLKNKMKAPQPFISFLPRFEMARKDLMKTWIQNYITKDEDVLQELYDEHFSSLSGQFRMRVAERSIRDLYQKINKKDPQISRILNL